MPAPLDLSIVIVNWNVRELLRRCLTSIRASDAVQWGDEGQGKWRAEVIVVDNASADHSVEMLRQDFPAVQVMVNGANVGFTRANNQGLALSQGRYVLFLNPDTELARAALDTMLRYMEAHPHVGALGPQLRYGDGQPQSSRRRFPTPAIFFLESTPLQRVWPRSRVLSRYYVLDRPDDAISQVDWVVGACLLARRTALAPLGGFDEGFFMYSEELDLCRRLVQAGWQVVYLPQAVVTHHEGKSSEQAVAARDIHFHTSRLRYVRLYHSRALAALLRGFLLLSFAWQWLVEATKLLTGFVIPSQRARRRLRRQRMAAYAQVLRSGLRSPRS